MNKSELVSRLTERLGGDRAIATAAVNGVLEEIESSVARGERVSLVGFGTFDRRERAPRTGRNPRTGATIQLDASVAPVFRPGAGFRSLLSGNGGSAVAEAPSGQATHTDAGRTDGADTKKASEKATKKALKQATKKAAGAADSGKGGKKAKKLAAKSGKKGN